MKAIKTLLYNMVGVTKDSFNTKDRDEHLECLTHDTAFSKGHPHLRFLFFQKWVSEDKDIGIHPLIPCELLCDKCLTTQQQQLFRVRHFFRKFKIANNGLLQKAPKTCFTFFSYHKYRAVACFWPPVSRIWHTLAVLFCLIGRILG